MQLLADSPGETSGETSSESSPSPRTPLNADEHFLHEAMNQRKSAFSINPCGSALHTWDLFSGICPLKLLHQVFANQAFVAVRRYFSFVPDTLFYLRRLSFMLYIPRRQPFVQHWLPYHQIHRNLPSIFFYALLCHA
jgi:hypothetical protein